MHLIKVGACSLNQTPLDWAHNQANIIQAIEKAKATGISVLCLPELCITGYGCEDAFLSKNTFDMALNVLKTILPKIKGIAVTLGLPILHREALYNTVCLCVNGKILGFVGKQYLAGDGLHYEPRWFKPWPCGVTSTITLFEEEYPIGDLVFDLSGIRIGFEICEDAWVATRTGIRLAERGVDLILNSSASHFSFGKSEIRKRFVLEGARAFGVGYIYVNLLGNEAGRIVYDGDTLIASGNQPLVQGRRFSFEDSVLLDAVIDIDNVRMERAARVGAPSSLENTGGIIRSDFSLPVSTANGSSASGSENWEKSPYKKEEEFARATALGLFDYLRKSKALGFVLNFSGGADSGTVACLVVLMVHLAFKELGAKAFFQKLNYIQSLDSKKHISPDLIVKELLYALYQATENNFETTKQAAQTLAEALNFTLAELNIDPIIQAYCQLIEPLIGRKLTWEQDDITLQNIQARVRSPSAWMLANIRDAILLSTSNRSEAAVGYATMDGDTSGGLCPIAGVDKSFILEWLHWLETVGIAEMGKVEALKVITNQVPTAELRPKGDHQTDEDDLMPYVWLDRIERLFVREKQSPIEIFRILMNEHPDEGKLKLANYIARFFSLWCYTQWKRERFAPTLHLDNQSVDPRTWCRFPILSGGYFKEIESLFDLIKSGKS